MLDEKISKKIKDFIAIKKRKIYESSGGSGFDEWLDGFDDGYMEALEDLERELFNE